MRRRLAATVVVLASAACSDGGDGGLLYPAEPASTTGGSWADASATDAWVAKKWGDSASGAWGDAAQTGGDSAGPSDPQSLFEALLPALESTCGPCHVQGTNNAPAYLGGADPYTTIKEYAGIVVSNPQESILLTKGAHEGPSLVDPLRTSIVGWLTAEAPGAPQAPVSTAAFAVTQGANSVDLSKWIQGASLTFNALTTGSVITLSAITLVAPASSGVQIVYPLFYIVPPTGPQIVNQTFSNVDQTVAAGQSATVGPGIAPLNSWTKGDALRIAFTKLVASP